MSLVFIDRGRLTGNPEVDRFGQHYGGLRDLSLPAIDFRQVP